MLYLMECFAIIKWNGRVQMKKFMLSCVAVLAVITIAGCSNSTVATTKGGKVTQEDLYESMKETAGPAALQKINLKRCFRRKLWKRCNR